jgi:hypothetical protein
VADGARRNVLSPFSLGLEQGVKGAFELLVREIGKREPNPAHLTRWFHIWELGV